MPDAHRFHIVLGGRLDPDWLSEWLGDVAAAGNPDGTTLVVADLIDDTALHGLLARIRDLGAPLLSLHRLPRDSDESPTVGEGQASPPP